MRRCETTRCCGHLPLYIFAGDFLLCVRLRTADLDVAAGSLEEVQRHISRIRARWPKTRILLRADSGFAQDELMTWCEQNGIDSKSQLPPDASQLFDNRDGPQRRPVQSTVMPAARCRVSIRHAPRADAAN